MRRSQRRLAVATSIILVSAGGAAVGIGGGTGASPRQEQIAQRGAGVMPFDLDATTHRFIKRTDGGDQIVVADDAQDRRQVQLIQQHLREEARAFGRGEFDDPAAIHGAQMPGLAALRNAGDKLSIEFERRSDGARLTYRSDDAAVRDALHEWFDAQVTDHGAHASPS